MARKDNSKKPKKPVRPEPNEELRAVRKRPVSKTKYNHPKRWLTEAEDDEDFIDLRRAGER